MLLPCLGWGSKHHFVFSNWNCESHIEFCTEIVKQHSSDIDAIDGFSFAHAVVSDIMINEMLKILWSLSLPLASTSKFSPHVNNNVRIKTWLLNVILLWSTPSRRSGSGKIRRVPPCEIWFLAFLASNFSCAYFDFCLFFGLMMIS